jgi:uncharacterized membrane protein
MEKHRTYPHYLKLLAIIALGVILRLWNLGFKPLWMDEVTTAIFSLGKNFDSLPLNIVFPLEQVETIFRFQPGVSCNQIAENLAHQSTHPPLFFCMMYSWLDWLHPLGTEWVSKLRSFPMLCGIGTILAIYGVNAVAFSPASGIMAALLMAISPFAVYLSQEARHYTLPVLLITLSLLCLVQIQRDIFEKVQVKFWVWVLWAIINIIGLYVHYFFAIAFIAEIVTLLLLIYRYQINIHKKRQFWIDLTLYISGIILSFTPWLFLVVNHFRSSDTNWIAPVHDIAPFYETLISWVLMVILLPVENQPLPMTIFCGALMVTFFFWMGWLALRNFQSLWWESTTHLATFTLVSFTLCVLLEFLAIAYCLGKDITAVPRYSFVYYPGFCALLGASLARIRNTQKIAFLLVGIISCSCVVSNLAFQKPFQPDQVAQKMNIEPKIPIMLVTAYDSNQDISLGLSFALALKKLRSDHVNSPLALDNVALLRKSSAVSLFIQNLTQLSLPNLSKLNLWIVGPGMLERDFPLKLKFIQKLNCDIDPTQHYRIGIPYQLYHCKN